MHLIIRIIIVLSVVGSPMGGYAQTTGASQQDHASAEAVVRELYDLVTFDAGSTPNWTAVRALFLDQALIVLRTSREASTVFSVEGFVQDFVRFIDQAQVEKTGFTERILKLKPFLFGDIAHVLVLYEASIPGSSRPPQQGVDSFHLIQQEGRWWIASIINEIPTAERPVPAELRE